MRHVLPPVWPALATLALIAAPAHAEKLTMNLAKFDKVQVAALMHVELKQGKQDVTVEEDHGDWSDLKIEVRNGTLYVSRKGDRANNTSNRDVPDYEVTITAPDFRSIAVAAASELEGRNLTLDKVGINISSASSADLAGACKSILLNVSSGASFDGERLHCRDANVSASTGASVSLWVSGKATAHASTGGSIIFSGNPKDLDEKTSLGGSVSVD